jgi:cation transport regulator ChaC
MINTMNTKANDICTHSDILTFGVDSCMWNPAHMHGSRTECEYVYKICTKNCVQIIHLAH